MGFYTSPSFFACLAVLAVPAAVLGLTGRSLRGYGFAASCAMLVLMFSASVEQLAFFVGYVALASAATWATYASFTRGGRSMAVYRASLALTIAPLAIYKVTLACTPQGVMGFVGISYITFKAVQVVVEIRDGLITRINALDYLYFLTFFATFTSGPIDRSRRFERDAHRRLSRDAYADLLAHGILWLAVGAVMQLVMASVLSNFMDASPAVGLPTLDALSMPHALRATARAYCYGLYLFFDFAGYSYMAMGASAVLGIGTPRNFRAPFAATDLKDFWNRWHITLSTWLRDFVFMRVTRGLMKRRVFRGKQARLHTACAGFMANMLLMGAWHGLTPSYLAYGLYHGLLLAATEVYQKRCPFHKRHTREGLYIAVSRFVTLQLVIFGFALFSGQVQTILERMMLHG